MSVTLLVFREPKSNSRYDRLFVNYGDRGEVTIYPTKEGNMDDIHDQKHKDEFMGMRLEISESSFESLWRIYREARIAEEEAEMIKAQIIRYRYPNPSFGKTDDPAKFLVGVSVWSRDCDNVQTTVLRKIEATPEAYAELEGDIESGAEGPYSLAIISPDEVENFTSSWRDRGMEAYEDGHPHIIY